MNRGTTLPVDLRLFSRLNMVTGLERMVLSDRTNFVVPYTSLVEVWTTRA